MGNEITLHLLCGKMASGKSTLAKELAEKNRAILLVDDNWLSQLYVEEITDIQTYLKYSERLKITLSTHIKSLLTLGMSVVLDFPANTIEQRKWYRAIFEETTTSHKLHFVNVSNDICKHQLRKRSKNLPEGSAFTSDAEFDEITKYFQTPSKNEGFNIIMYPNK